MKAYKIFDADLKCRDYQYEIGKTYEIEGKLKLPEYDKKIFNEIRGTGEQ